MSVKRSAQTPRRDMEDTPESLYEKANRFKMEGRIQDAVANYDAALRLKPNFPEALCSSAILLLERGFYDAALRFLDQALRLKPDFPEALFNRGNVLQQMLRYAEAAESYSQALAFKPDQAGFHINYGAALYELGSLEEAIASYQTALLLDPAQAQGALNLGNALMKAGRLEHALAAYNLALKLRPNYSRAFCGKGIVLKELGRFDEALSCFDKALELDPDSNEAISNRGCLLLLLGDFERGWQGYERRWVLGDLSAMQLNFKLPSWNGKNPLNLRILVMNDHALGDIIQFSRFLLNLVHSGAKVTFLCPAKMHHLISTLHTDIRLIDKVDQESDYDCQVMLGSLPFVLDIVSTTIPAKQAYLQPDSGLVSGWQAKIGQAGFKIGISWQGNADIKVDPQRSFPLEMFSRLAAIPNVRLISLQKGFGSEQIAKSSFAARIENLEPFDEGVNAFADTAAIMQSLDLIITCDTSIAHLAGALGRPVWTVLKHIPEWRWQLNRTDSPWYPTMTLFRQETRGQWSDVFTHMASRIYKMDETVKTIKAKESGRLVHAPVSIGELLDKITILEIKSERIADPLKLENIRNELDILRAVQSSLPLEQDGLPVLIADLKAVNSDLWIIEDDIRDCEKQQDFGPEFIRLARSVYIQNDKRAKLKHQINIALNSELVEEKSYAAIA
eukprot:gene7739-7801_t